MPKVKANTHNKSNKSNKLNDGALNYLQTQIVCFIVYIVVFLFGCLIAFVSDSSDNTDIYFSLTAFGVSSFISGFIGGNKIRKNGILTGLIYALPSNIIVILSAVVSTGFKADFRLAITVAILLLSSVAGGVVAVNKRHRR